MDEDLSKLKQQIGKIERLKTLSEWGPDFQLWERTTKKLVTDLFGLDAQQLFDQQKTMTTSYIDRSFNLRQYIMELDNRRRILEGLIAELREAPTVSEQSSASEKGILKEIWKGEAALRENLLKIAEVQRLHQGLLDHLEKTLAPSSLPGLRFIKLKGQRRTWWHNQDGYPSDNPWSKFQPFLELLEQHEAEKTIKHRLQTEGLFVESRSQGEDQHLIVGRRDGKAEKAHVIIDGKSGDIRTEDGQQEATEIVAHIETILTLPNGKRVRTTREAIEELPPANS